MSTDSKFQAAESLSMRRWQQTQCVLSRNIRWYWSV